MNTYLLSDRMLWLTDFNSLSISLTWFIGDFLVLALSVLDWTARCLRSKETQQLNSKCKPVNLESAI